MIKTEKQLHNYYRKQCKQFGVGCYKLHCEGQTGFPDLMLSYNGWTFFVELKSPAGTGVLSPRQKLMHKKLIKQGQEIYVSYSKESADLIISELINARPKLRC